MQPTIKDEMTDSEKTAYSRFPGMDDATKENNEAENKFNFLII